MDRKQMRAEFKVQQYLPLGEGEQSRDTASFVAGAMTRESYDTDLSSRTFAPFTFSSARRCTAARTSPRNSG